MIFIKYKIYQKNKPDGAAVSAVSAVVGSVDVVVLSATVALVASVVPLAVEGFPNPMKSTTVV